MSGAQSSERRIQELMHLRDRIDTEIVAVYERASKRRRSSLVVPECGTETAYQRHLLRGEKCLGCTRAHALNERVKAVVRDARRRATRASREAGAA